jgi:hypothetical protein
MDGWSDQLLRGMVCFSLALGFEEDRARYGVAEAVNRLRNALVENDLWLSGDDQLLSGILAGELSSEQVAEALCSARRIGFMCGTAH